MKGIGALFEKYELDGYQATFDSLREQIDAYNRFVHEDILPRTRTDFRLPKEVYTFRLKEYGVDTPHEVFSIWASTSGRLREKRRAAFSGKRWCQAGDARASWLHCAPPE